MQYDKQLIDTARHYFPVVYVDQDTGTAYKGTSGYTGDRVRIYTTDWEYEEADILKTNAELAAYIAEYEEMIGGEY